MRPRWRFLNTGAADGPYNMAVDEAILRSVRKQQSPPTLRIYAWNPAAISVGYGQPVHRDIDVEKCRRSGTPIVRRLTGGRAVLHDEEITYSVVACENDPAIGQSIQETYKRIGQALVCGLRRLGVDAQLQKISKGSGRNPSCFSSTGRYEVVVGERKLIGSAQRRFKGAVLQQGSLLTGNGYKDLFRFLLMKNRDSQADGSPNHVITLTDILPHKPTYAHIVEVLHRGFEEAFDCQLIEEEVSEEERKASEQLRAERYQSDGWNLRR